MNPRLGHASQPAAPAAQAALAARGGVVCLSVFSVWLAVPLPGESLDAGTVACSLAVMATVLLSRRMALPATAPR